MAAIWCHSQDAVGVVRHSLVRDCCLRRDGVIRCLDAEQRHCHARNRRSTAAASIVRVHTGPTCNRARCYSAMAAIWLAFKFRSKERESMKQMHCLSSVLGACLTIVGSRRVRDGLLHESHTQLQCIAEHSEWPMLRTFRMHGDGTSRRLPNVLKLPRTKHDSRDGVVELPDAGALGGDIGPQLAALREEERLVAQEDVAQRGGQPPVVEPVARSAWPMRV